jgi:hypothetical protein
MKKVRISANWDTSENLTKRLLYQFTTDVITSEGIEFVYDDSYDVIVFLNHINLPIKEKTKVFVFPHEPTWAGSHQLNYNNHNNIKVLGFDKKFYTPQEVCEETLAHTFYGGRGPWVDKEEDWNWQKVTTHQPIKKKNISSIVTNLNSDDTTYEGCSYRVRYNLTDYLINNSDFIDFFGGWEKNEEPEKKSAVENYRFCIGIENQFVKNWITEKFYDCILYNCIPIYYGCQNVKEIYPEDGYIIIENIEDPKSVLEQLNYINQNAEKIYQEKLSGLLQIKKRYFSDYNLLKKIKELTNDI